MTGIILLLYVTMSVSRHAVSATTRYLPSNNPSSPWLSVSSSLYQPPLLSTLLQPPNHKPVNNNNNNNDDNNNNNNNDKNNKNKINNKDIIINNNDDNKKISDKNNKKNQKLPQVEERELTIGVTPPSVKFSADLAAKALHRDLMRLSRLLPGVYTNMQQYRQEAGRAVPHQQRHVLLRSTFRPITLRFLPRAFCVLVQDYSGDSLFPFRQRVYTFSSDIAHRAIRMKVWNFATKRVEKKATQNLNHFHRLRRKDLVSQESCDMFWRRLDRTTFMGITGKQCLGYVKGEQVRITVSMTLTSQLLQTNEGWYRARDGKTLVEVDIPYNLLRTKAFPDSRKKQRSRKIPARWRPMDANFTQNDLPLVSSPTSVARADARNSVDHPLSLPSVRNSDTVWSGQSKRPAIRLSNKKDRSSTHKSKAHTPSQKDRKEKHKEWILSNYEEIAKALHSGHLVFYSVELTACTLPAQMKAERLSFGDFVDSFQSTHRNSEKDEATIRFWQSKFVQGDEGMEKITREITIQNNGKVQVRLLRKSMDTDKLSWDHSAQCKLYNPDTGMGGVKMTSRPAADVHEISTFGRFRAALRRGRRQVRMIIDLTHCDGRTRESSSIMGTTVRAYDFINQGKAVEVSQLTPDAEHTHYSLLTGHFLNNGEVIFITSLQPLSGKKMHRSLPLFYRDSTYRCALSGSDVTNSNGSWGVRLFYTT